MPPEPALTEVAGITREPRQDLVAHRVAPEVLGAAGAPRLQKAADALQLGQLVLQQVDLGDRLSLDGLAVSLNIAVQGDGGGVGTPVEVDESLQGGVGGTVEDRKSAV